MDEFEVSDIQHSFKRIDSPINLAPGDLQLVLITILVR